MLPLGGFGRGQELQVVGQGQGLAGQAAGLIRLNWAFIAITSRLRPTGWVAVRWCGVNAASCFLITFAPWRSIESSFCWGSR